MKRFDAIDPSEVTQGQRNVLSVNLPELLTLYRRAKPAKREDLRGYRLRKWMATFADFPAWDLDVEHITAMVDQFDNHGYAGTTINREIADIGGCYSWAILKRHCPDGFLNPTREYVAREDIPRVVELSEDDVNALLAAAKVSVWPKLYALVLMAIHTGARKSEMTGLTWADIDYKTRRADLHTTKNGKPRRLLLTPPVIAAIEAIQPKPCAPDMLIFCGRNAFRAHEFRKSWERCREEAGLPDLHFHDLRHAACARMLKNGGGIHAVANVLGHSDTRMISQRYGHLDDDHLQDVVDAASSAA
jgi:integrase